MSSEQTLAQIAAELAADDRLWTTQQDVELNLLAFVHRILDAQRTPCCAGLREAWEAGVKLARSYGDNIIHFEGEQKERQWQKFLETHPCSCQRTKGKEGDAPCEKNNVTAQSGSEETSGDTAVIVHSDSGEPDSSSLPVAETPASVGSKDLQWTIVESSGITQVHTRTHWVGETDDPKVATVFKELVDLHNAAIRQSAPAVEAWRDIMQGLVIWLQGALNCKTYVWEPDQRDAAQSVVIEANDLLRQRRVSAPKP